MTPIAFHFVTPAGAPFSIDWTLADNTVRTLDAVQMLAVGTAMGEHISVVHAHGRQLREAIWAAEDAAALELLTW